MKSVAYVKYTCKAKLVGSDGEDIKFKRRLVVRQVQNSGSINVQGREEVDIMK
jgi:hypothetical protein